MRTYFLRKQNVFFYHRDKLNILLDCLHDHGIKYTKDEILTLSCTWDKKRDKLQDQLIHILFGNIDICSWSTDTFRDKPYVFENLNSDLKKAYRQFLRINVTLK